jgi:hypothetical protein
VELTREKLQNTREAWLMRACEIARPEFVSAGSPIPSALQVSVGWAYGSRKAIGQCFQPDAAKDKMHHIFVSPKLEAVDEVLATLWHELAHAALPPGTKHRAPFARLALAVGLEGKATSTVGGELFKRNCEKWGGVLGPYPHGSLSLNTQGKKQTTRLLKVACPDCGYTARITRQWVEQGLPTCICGSKWELPE